jgi:hypothetical protein
MKKFLCLQAFCLVCCAVLANAEEPAKKAADLRRDVSPGATTTQLTPTPEMWFYEQERARYEDPKAAVRRKAEFRAAQRSNRIESMHWFGMSNARPTATATPLFGTYSPMWTSNTGDPSRWRSSVGQNTIVVVPNRLY